jgi:hypothetical protein
MNVDQVISNTEDLGGWRDTVINWEHHVEKTVDDYLPFTTLDDAVQKDAIQNSWDARTSRKGTGWQCELELRETETGRRILVVRDSGTAGLTGRVLEPAEYYNDMPEEERWARFESLAFTHRPGEDSEALGARGQGKFIFVGASKSRTILYDSLRADGSYRLGARLVKQTRSPINHWDDADAVEQLAKWMPGLQPLAVRGTRVIIDDPVDEVVDSILSGSMQRHIGDTWWPIILKFGADIRVSISLPGEKRQTRVGVPGDVIVPEADVKNVKVWHRPNATIDFGGHRYRIKGLHVMHRAGGSVRPELQGVSLIRGGMVVTRLPMRYVPPKIANAVTGYVEFDEELDREMKAVEHPTHYTFDMKRGVPYRLKQWVEEELQKFATEKLGIGGQPSVNVEARRREAELRALAEINRLAKDLGLVGPTGGAGGYKGTRKGGRKTLELLAARLDEPILPSPGRRIEFGEALRNIRVRLDNNTPDAAQVRYSLYLTRGDVVVRQFIPDTDITIGAKSQSDWTAAAELTFNPDDHPAGVYVLRARLLVLESPHRPKMYQHRDSFRFWLAEDPPIGGIFEDVDALEYPEEFGKIDGEVVPGKSGGHIFQYNLDHPAFTRVSGDDEDVSEYLFGLMARELVRVDLESGNPVLLDPSAFESPADQQRRVSEVMGEIMFNHHSHA